MTALASLRRRDRVLHPSGIAPPIDVSPLVGTWINTETRWQWLSRIEIREDNGGVLVRAHGAAEWDETRATIVCAGGFVAEFSLPGMQTKIMAMVHQGLLVLVAFNDFRDGTSRFAREFFRQ